MSKRKRILLALLPSQEENIKRTLVTLGYERLNFLEPGSGDTIITEITKAMNGDSPFGIIFIAKDLQGLEDGKNGVDILKDLRNRHNLETPIVVVYDVEPDMLENLDVLHQHFAATLAAPFSEARVEAVLKHVHKPKI